MNKHLHLVVTVLLAATLVVSCSQKKVEKKEHQKATRYTSYAGTLSVSADSGLENILKQQEQIFEFTYDSVQVNIQYKNEKEIFEDFRTKKSTAIVLARKLEQTEINDLKNFDTIYTREIPVAYDAVALIGNPNFDDKQLDVEALRKYFSPQNSKDGSLKLVFESQQSSVVKYVLGVLGYKDKVSSNVYALQSAQEVIDYVSKTENAIGFVPYNLLSDADDRHVTEILKRVKILSLRAKNKEGEVRRVSANQSDIAAGDYPLIRTWNAIARYTYSDNLEMLFLTFLTKERAAKIFLKAGLIPVKTPEREIIVNDKPLEASKP